MKEIIQRVGLTSILVTHDREEAFDIADRVVVFNRYARSPRSLGHLPHLCINLLDQLSGHAWLLLLLLPCG